MIIAWSRLLRTEAMVRCLLGVGSGALMDALEVSVLRSEMGFNEVRALRFMVDGPRDGVLGRVGVAVTTAMAGCCGGSCSGSGVCSTSISGAGRFREAGSSPKDCWGRGAVVNGDDRKPKARRRMLGRVGVAAGATRGGEVVATGDVVSMAVVVRGGDGESAMRARVMCCRKAV